MTHGLRSAVQSVETAALKRTVVRALERVWVDTSRQGCDLSLHIMIIVGHATFSEPVKPQLATHAGVETCMPAAGLLNSVISIGFATDLRFSTNLTGL